MKFSGWILLEYDHEQHLQVNVALDLVDTQLANLYSQLMEHGLLGCVDIVVVSDHGMASVRWAIDYNHWGLDRYQFDWQWWPGIEFHGITQSSDPTSYINVY